MVASSTAGASTACSVVSGTAAAGVSTGVDSTTAGAVSVADISAGM